MARWQASTLIDEVNWKIEHGVVKEGEVVISRLDEFVYVAKHYLGTIVVMIVCLFYIMLVFTFMYRQWKQDKIAT
jgi:hypothetical protein